jgi:hypothetical protein
MNGAPYYSRISLHFASQNNNSDHVFCLVANKANLNQIDGRGIIFKKYPKSFSILQ